MLKIFKRTDEDLDRVDREVEAVRRVAEAKCEYVPEVFEYGKRRIGSQECIYILEERLEARTLREKMAAGPLSLPVVINYIAQLLSAVADLERIKLVHRDLKPENIMIDGSEKLWLIDFGLVRFMDLPSLTNSSDKFFPCTLGYAAREQIHNVKRKVDSRTDLFAVGAIAHELFLGRHHFLSMRLTPLQLIQAMESADFPPLTIAGDDGRLAGLVGRLAARFRTRRPATAKAALNEYEAIITSLYPATRGTT